MEIVLSGCPHHYAELMLIPCQVLPAEDPIVSHCLALHTNSALLMLSSVHQELQARKDSGADQTLLSGVPSFSTYLKVSSPSASRFARKASRCENTPLATSGEAAFCSCRSPARCRKPIYRHHASPGRCFT